MIRDIRQANRRVVRNTLLVVVAMFGFGYALVPLYDTFCRVFGLNGQTERIAAVPATTSVDESRTITVEFHAIVNNRLPWAFKPEVKRIQVHPGEVKQVAYLAQNLSGGRVVGQAVHSVTPETAAIHFKKTECFCYRQQMLESGESKEMPLVFMIDPGLPKGIENLTLTYTFFNAEKYASADSDGQARPTGAGDGGPRRGQRL